MKKEELAKKIWDYHRLNMPLKKCDCILALGSHDLRVAARAAELYKDGWAPYVMFSGNRGNVTQGNFEKPEAEVFAEIAINVGVHKDKIIIENKSTNTGQNIEFSRKIIEERKLDFDTFLLVQKPYMERRIYATFMKLWPEKEFVVTSPQISYEQYPDEKYSKDHLINMMVGDLQRIREYPKLGFQIEQEIPDDVWEAWEQLVAMGYNNHLIKEG